MPLAPLPVLRWPLGCLFAVSILVGACGNEPTWTEVTVTGAAETTPVKSEEDAADDPAIWIHPNDPAQSLVLGTNKRAGLHIFDLSGAELAFWSLGPINNVDVRQGVELGGTARDIGVASLREPDEIVYFELDPETGAFSGYGRIATGHEDPYGICLGRTDGALSAFVTYKDGTVQAFEITEGLPVPQARLVGEAGLGGQIEGCAFDDWASKLYVGEEEEGIHVFDYGTDAGFSDSAWVDRVRRRGPLKADVEGLAFVRDARGPLLVASAQGADAFVVYRGAAPYEKLALVRIEEAEGAGIDGVTHTDGIELTTANLGPEFPCGLFIVQDDSNLPEAQNFKLVDWCTVAPQIPKPAK